MRRKFFVALGGAAAIAYMNRKKIGHYAVGTIARIEHGVRELASQVVQSDEEDEESLADAASEGASA